MGEIFPPGLWLVFFWVRRKLLPVDADCLCSKLMSVLLDHLFAALANDVRFCLCWRIFLLHPEVTHFSRVQALFSIQHVSDIPLKGFEIIKVLLCSLFVKLWTAINFWLINPVKRYFSGFGFRLFSYLSKTYFSACVSELCISFLVNWGEFGVRAVAFIGNFADWNWDSLFKFLKPCLLSNNIKLVVSGSFVFKFLNDFVVWYDLGDGVLWVGVRHWQEVFAVNKDSTLLQNTERPFRASLFYVPKELVFKSLNN